jgi:hypothetical protein
MAGKPGEHFLCLNGDDWENGWWARQHGVTTRADYLRLVFEESFNPIMTDGLKPGGEEDVASDSTS